MSPRTALITGAAAGIGRATAQQLVAAGFQVVLVARDHRSAAATLDDLRGSGPHPERVLDAYHGDLLDRRAVPHLVDELTAAGQRIDVLVNNAGAAFDRFEETGDGAERSHALNHHAPFRLTHGLLAAGLLTEDARIINVASDLEKKGTLDPAAPDVTGLTWRTRYAQTPVYGTSKLLNLLATRELARRLPAGMNAYIAIPGVARTGFLTAAGGTMARAARVLGPFLASADKAARTAVVLATSASPPSPGGGVFAKAKPTHPSAVAQDDALAATVYVRTAAALGIEPLDR